MGSEGGTAPSPSGAATATRRTGLRAWITTHRPAILLVALAITIPELLTGSTPVLALVDPLAVLGLMGLYGAGALLVRDFSLRWKTGWSGVLLLGLAYGVAEEGIATKTWVDPSSRAAGFLASYGRFGGVNWDWAVVLTVFHAVFSIAIPILLVELAFPHARGTLFLTDRGSRWAMAAYLATVVVDFFGLDPHYFEGFVLLGSIAALALLLVVIAHALSKDVLLPLQAFPSRSPSFFFGVGALFSGLWALFYLLVPHLTPSFEVTILGEVALALGTAAVLRRTLGREENRAHQAYLVGGLLSWYVPWAVVLSFMGDFLVVPVLALVYLLVYRVAREARASSDASRVPLLGPQGQAPTD